MPQRTPEERAALLTAARSPFGEGSPADALFLCGDVGCPFGQDYERFLRRVSCLYSLVLLVPGNHEYVWEQSRGARPDFEDVRSRLESLESRCGDRLRVLDEGRSLRVPFGSTPGLAIAGATLWTNVSPADDGSLGEKLERSYAWYHGRTFEPDDVRSLHRSHVRALESVVRDASRVGDEVCLLTHHCPWGIPARKMESVYVTDLPRRHPALFLTPVRTWCYGHTHRPFDGRVGTTRLLSNPLGYPHEKIPFDRRKRLSFALP